MVAPVRVVAPARLATIASLRFVMLGSARHLRAATELPMAASRTLTAAALVQRHVPSAPRVPLAQTASRVCVPTMSAPLPPVTMA